MVYTLSRPVRYAARIHICQPTPDHAPSLQRASCSSIIVRHANANERGVCELEVLGVAPNVFAPVLDKLGVLAVLGLEVLEAPAEDEDLVGNVLAVALKLVARLCVYLDRRTRVNILDRERTGTVCSGRTRAAFGPLQAQTIKGRSVACNA